MREIEEAVEVGVDRLAASSELEESGLFASVALIPLQAGDAVTDSLGPVERTTLGDLNVKRFQLMLLEPDGDLCCHVPNVHPAHTNWYAH